MMKMRVGELKELLGGFDDDLFVSCGPDRYGDCPEIHGVKMHSERSTLYIITEETGERE